MSQRKGTQEQESAPTLPAGSGLAATIADAAPLSAPGPLAPDGALASDPALRYVRGALIGEGGMGQVHLCRDGQIGRDVAYKSIRAGHGSRSDARARFVREARVQGQLEHPSIVPVYDLGIGAGGDAYFTMKRVRGRTLEDAVAALRRGDADAAHRFSRRKLLAAFGSVCLAVDFAHARGVLHRDLKPSNVMLGDFGEVYVLDWGLAKVAGAIDLEPARADDVDPDADTATGAPASDASTRQGEVLGTPGYMAPEQASGDHAAVDARSDVYSLGAILFELLAWEPLHARGPTQRVLLATLQGADARASVRAPERDVPPELEAICVRATALDPAARFPTVRALEEAVEHFLDGDRDLERRRALASEHAATAAAHAASAFAGGPAAHTERAAAVRALGRALAFDPDHAGARRTLVRLLVEPPATAPPEAQAALDESEAATRRLSARQGFVAYLGLLLTLPLLLWMGVRDWTPILASMACIVAAALLSGAVARSKSAGETLTFLVFGVSCASITLFAPIFGPLVIMPGVAAVNTLSFASELGRTRRFALVGVGALTIFVPWVLQWAGLFAPSYVFAGGAMAMVPHAVSFPARPTLVVLLVLNLANVIVPSFLVGRVRDALADARRRVELHAWHLRQLVPSD
jgi:serine/threonine-protein kinase